MPRGVFADTKVRGPSRCRPDHPQPLIGIIQFDPKAVGQPVILECDPYE